MEGGIFGYDGFQSRRLISEMLGLKRYWETLVRVFESGVLGLDEDGRVLLANPAATGLFGRSETRIIGESLAALFSAPDRRTIQQAIGELKKTRLPEDRQLESSVGEQRVRLRLSSIVEDGACSGVLAILEPMPPRTKR
jgi:PAS domain S-box-containing protein